MLYVWLGIIFAFVQIDIKAAASLPAAIVPAPTTVRERWLTCVDAIGEGNIERFKSSFTLDLLHTYMPLQVSTQAPRVRPVNLAHIAILSRHENAVHILAYMIEHGLNINTVQSFPYEDISIEMRQEGIRLSSYAGRLSTSLLLDVAVATGNVPSVRLLLDAGADPYMTSSYRISSWWQILLKECVTSYIGENPLDHALMNKRAAESSPDSLPASAQQYDEIARILTQAQLAADYDAIGRGCSIL